MSSSTFFCLLFLYIIYSYADYYDVKSITTIKDYAKDVDWSRSRNLIASAKIGADGYYDVFVVKPDGGDEKNLTHNYLGCPQKHNGNVAWHSSGDFIIFTAQNEDTPKNKIVDRMGVPGTGLNCNLWIMKSDGSRFWQLTNYSTSERMGRAKGVIHPQFSHDGRRLLWAERLGPGPAQDTIEQGGIEQAENEGAGVGGKWANFKNMNPKEKRQLLLKRRQGGSGQGQGAYGAKQQDSAFIWGEWALKVADFIADPENPKIINIKTYQPGEQRAFYESHGFSADDKKILFSGNLTKGQPAVGLDIYEMDLETQQVRNLTNSFEEWDEHAHYSPDGRRVVWMSSHGFDLPYASDQGRGWAKYLKTELCIMNIDGSDKRRLTHFNEPGHSEYMDGARCIVADSAFSPDGAKMAVAVAHIGQNKRAGGKLDILEFSGGLVDK